MSTPHADAETMGQPAPAVVTTESVVVAQAPVPAAAPAAVSSPAPHLPITAAGSGTALARLQATATRALAETIYQLRRLGASTVAGIAAVVLAATLFIASNLPQSATVAALKDQLVRLAPAGKGAAVAVPGAATLAALPPRGEAPNIVLKILEEAKASGVELPRGEYEYVPARDGIAARYRMTFPLHASYPKIREFMDRTLVALPAVAVEGLRIERKNVGDDSVDAELKLAAYVRSEQ